MKGIKKLGLCLILLAAVSTSLEAATLKEKLEKKLASKFMAAGNWISDFDEARKKAKKENKPIFAYFTRSYSP